MINNPVTDSCSTTLVLYIAVSKRLLLFNTKILIKIIEEKMKKTNLKWSEDNPELLLVSVNVQKSLSCLVSHIYNSVISDLESEEFLILIYFRLQNDWGILLCVFLWASVVMPLDLGTGLDLCNANESDHFNSLDLEQIDAHHVYIYAVE